MRRPARPAARQLHRPIPFRFHCWGDFRRRRKPPCPDRCKRFLFGAVRASWHSAYRLRAGLGGARRNHRPALPRQVLQPWRRAVRQLSSPLFSRLPSSAPFPPMRLQHLAQEPDRALGLRCFRRGLLGFRRTDFRPLTRLHHQTPHIPAALTAARSTSFSQNLQDPDSRRYRSRHSSARDRTGIRPLGPLLPWFRSWPEPAYDCSATHRP